MRILASLCLVVIDDNTSLVHLSQSNIHCHNVLSCHTMSWAANRRRMLAAIQTRMMGIVLVQQTSEVLLLIHHH